MLSTVNIYSIDTPNIFIFSHLYYILVYSTSALHSAINTIFFLPIMYIHLLCVDVLVSIFLLQQLFYLLVLVPGVVSSAHTYLT